MKKIIWFSRHAPIQKQIDELERIYGEVNIIQDRNPFSSADDVVKRFNSKNADEMVIVAPLSVIDAITKRGIKPLYAEMELVHGSQYDVMANGRKFIFKEFVRINKVTIEKEKI